MKKKNTLVVALLGFINLSAQEVLWQKDVQSSTQDF